MSSDILKSLHRSRVITVDENKRTHSFHGQPAYVTAYVSQWFHHGLIHRGNDLPALKMPHSLSWYVKGQMHRANGPAEILKRNKAYALFGFPISKNGFKIVTSHSKDKGFPLWVSWLLYYEVIDNDDFDFLVDTHGNWKEDYPSEWLLKAWDINILDIEAAFFKKPLHTRVGRAWQQDYDLYGSSMTLDKFKAVIAHMEEEAAVFELELKGRKDG